MDEVRGLNWYIMRGNHDDRYWEKYSKKAANRVKGYSFDKDGYVVKDTAPTVHYLRDGGGYIEDIGVFYVPGAYSVDRYYRKSIGAYWNPDELLYGTEKCILLSKLKGLLEDGVKPKAIVSHTCPLSWEDRISDLFLAKVDQSSVDKSQEEFLDDVLEAVQEKVPDYKWYFGHYHDDREVVDGHAYMLYDKPAVIED
jgi:hypothetical protein